MKLRHTFSFDVNSTAAVAGVLWSSCVRVHIMVISDS